MEAGAGSVRNLNIPRVLFILHFFKLHSDEEHFVTVKDIKNACDCHFGNEQSISINTVKNLITSLQTMG